MRVIDRLQEYLTRKNISPYNFEKNCGIANGYLSKQMKGKGSIGSEIINKIKEKYKDLNITWLLTGEGQMLTSHFYVQSDQVSALAENEVVYETQQHTIKTLREKILILESALADKEKIIKLLEKQLSQ
jgi:transcriptional regulator with XRE-family HTH domain